MTVYYAAWEGATPLSNAHATSEYQRLVDTASPEPPSAAMVSFVRAMDSDAGHPPPWVDGDLIDKANGPIVVFGVADDAAGDIRKMVETAAADSGVVAYDPQLGELVPSATTVARSADFDLPAASELPLHLNAVIGEALDVGDTMAGIVEQVETAFYVQWMAQAGELTIEVQGEGLVPPDMALDDAGRSQMTDLGFSEAQPNWSAHWGNGYEALEQAAQILTHVLITVRNMPMGTPMRLQTFPV